MKVEPERSYDARTYNSDFDREVERLRAQVALSWRKESRNLQWFGLRDGMTVADFGCGPGSYTERLAELIPSSQITGIDIDPELIARAQELFAGQARMRFIEASAESTGLLEGSCDFVVSRFLLQHVPDPVAVAREMLRVLKPGGTVVITEMDADNVLIRDPAFPSFNLAARFNKLQEQRGGDRKIGRRLWRIFKQAGFVDLDLEATVQHTDELGVDAFTLNADPSLLVPLLERGVISQAEADTWAHERDAHYASAYPYTMSLYLMLVGKKLKCE